ncbi:MAG: ArsR family transcriptional regulator [Clostridia bacterium]|nr:ArsR family transcriptional regulator [Clostridia bacterium]
MTQLTEFFKLVSDETRLRILVLLSQEDLYVCQLCGILNLSQPKVSRHLSKLRDLNNVADERKEKYILYSFHLKDPVIKEFIQSIVENISLYPILAEDQKRLADKQHYLSQCKTRCSYPKRKEEKDDY